MIGEREPPPIEQIRFEIERFLSTPTPEVLCIRGQWGVGKTFVWQQSVDAARRKCEGLALKRYAYTSLFGVGSIDGLKLAIFENSEFLVPADANNDLRSFLKKGGNFFSRQLPWSREVAIELPVIGPVMKAAGPLFFQAIRNQILCIDDLERRGENLRVVDVLGLISFLKEQRHCKVVLLLNDKELGDDQQDFEQHAEKVLDLSLRFEPSAKEACEIAFPSPDFVSSELRKRAIALNIVNIRVLKKIEHAVRRTEALVAGLDERVLEQVVSTLVLLGWAKLQPGTAPPLDFIKKFGRGSQPTKDADPERTRIEEGWRQTIRGYGFAFFDGLDELLLEGLEKGYYDSKMVQAAAQQVNDAVKRDKDAGTLHSAWSLFRDSFDDNQALVAESIFSASLNNIAILTPYNLNTTIKLFRSIGECEKASKLIDAYVERRDEPARFWKLEDDVFLNVEDADALLLAKFREKASEDSVRPDLVQILTDIGQSSGWNPSDLKFLGTVTVEELVSIFKTASGESRKKLLKGALFFRSASASSEDAARFTKQVEDALRRIASETPINKERVRVLLQ